MIVQICIHKITQQGQEICTISQLHNFRHTLAECLLKLVCTYVFASAYMHIITQDPLNNFHEILYCESLWQIIKSFQFLLKSLCMIYIYIYIYAFLRASPAYIGITHRRGLHCVLTALERGLFYCFNTVLY